MKNIGLARKRRHNRIRKKVFGTATVPRLVVFRSLNNISGQLIDDIKGMTIVSVSSLEAEIKKKKLKKMENSRIIGKILAQKAKEKGIKKIVFDRGGYKYHGRVRGLAESVREEGIKF